MRFPNRTGASTKTLRCAYLRKMSIVMQADVDPATPALVLDVSVLLTEPTCVLSGQEELLKSVYRFWVKPGSVRKPNLPGLEDP